MRTIFRLCLVATVVAAVGLAAVPVADAKHRRAGHVSITNFEKKQNSGIRRAKRRARAAHERIEALKDWNFDQDAVNGSQQNSIIDHEGRLTSLQGLVDVIVAGAGDLVDGVLALQDALENDVAPALTAIDDALNDPTTGLVGLNLARPQFGVFDPGGTFLGGTSDAGASGPTGDATVAGSFYVIDFGNDVSSRVYQVNVFPDGASVAPVARVGSCATAGIDALCEGVETGSGGDPNKIVVQFGAGGSVPTTAFSVTAISG